MSYMTWSSDLDTGIPAIDKQHMRIVELINELDHATRTHNTFELRQVMDGLLDYTITHFDFEEELLNKVDYPYLVAHKRVHDIFKRKVADIRERADKGEDVAQVLLKLLTNWLASHIKSEDHDYVEMVKHAVEAEETSSWLNNALTRFFKK